MKADLTSSPPASRGRHSARFSLRPKLCLLWPYTLLNLPTLFSCLLAADQMAMAAAVTEIGWKALSFVLPFCLFLTVSQAVHTLLHLSDQKIDARKEDTLSSSSQLETPSHWRTPFGLASLFKAPIFPLFLEVGCWASCSSWLKTDGWLLLLKIDLCTWPFLTVHLDVFGFGF